MNDRATDKLSYRKALDGLVRMHQLFVEGKRKSDEVKRLRDELDEPFLNLTDEERAVLEGLSADLYDVEKIEKNLPSLHSPEIERIVLESMTAVDSGHLDRALDLLRSAKAYQPFSRISDLRSMIWRQKGEPNVAMLFEEHALKLNPTGDHLPIIQESKKGADSDCAPSNVPA